MDCPLCSTELRRTTYEGLPLFACDTCSGYLVATNRVSAIERRREKNAEDLMQEAAPAKLKDNQEALRCPRCRGRMMKEFAKSPAEFHIDTCERCDVVWFDAGELALIQLTFEATAAGQDAAQLPRSASHNVFRGKTRIRTAAGTTSARKCFAGFRLWRRVPGYVPTNGQRMVDLIIARPIRSLN